WSFLRVIRTSLKNGAKLQLHCKRLFFRQISGSAEGLSPNCHKEVTRLAQGCGLRLPPYIGPKNGAATTSSARSRSIQGSSLCSRQAASPSCSDCSLRIDLLQE